VAASLAGCAVIGPTLERATVQERIRKTGASPGSDATEVLLAFGTLGRAAGLELSTTYVSVEHTEHLNAASAGAHHFAVTRGVVESGNPCLIWGIAAHEIAHDVLGHSSERVIASTALGVLATIAGFFVPGAGYAVQGAGYLGLSAYGRSQEAEADARAAELLAKAGRPRWLLRYALEFITEVYGDRGGSWLDSHPATSERIEAQPAIDAAEGATVCPPPEDRAGQVEARRRAIRRAR
jgi:Zn-dependent protease with chaperone function